MTTSASISAVHLIRLRDELGAPMPQQVAASMALWLGIGSQLGVEYHEQCARILNEREQQRRAA